jgi:hypothetical protein
MKWVVTDRFGYAFVKMVTPRLINNKTTRTLSSCSLLLRMTFVKMAKLTRPDLAPWRAGGGHSLVFPVPLTQDTYNYMGSSPLLPENIGPGLGSVVRYPAEAAPLVRRCCGELLALL